MVENLDIQMLQTTSIIIIFKYKQVKTSNFNRLLHTNEREKQNENAFTSVNEVINDDVIVDEINEKEETTSIPVKR